jgi:hypothetical protein
MCYSSCSHSCAQKLLILFPLLCPKVTHLVPTLVPKSCMLNKFSIVYHGWDAYVLLLACVYLVLSTMKLFPMNQAGARQAVDDAIDIFLVLHQEPCTYPAGQVQGQEHASVQGSRRGTRVDAKALLHPAGHHRGHHRCGSRDARASINLAGVLRTLSWRALCCLQASGL